MSEEPITEPGIRGWLIIVTIFLFASPRNMISHASRFSKEFDNPLVRQFTDPASPAFDERWPVLIFLETGGFYLIAAVSMLVLWPLFVLRHRSFTAAFAFVSVIVACLILTRAGLATAIPTIASPHRTSIYSQTALSLPASLAGAIYIMRSRRAHLTFRRRLLFHPVFPFFTRL